MANMYKSNFLNNKEGSTKSVPLLNGYLVNRVKITHAIGSITEVVDYKCLIYFNDTLYIFMPCDIMKYDRSQKEWVRLNIEYPFKNDVNQSSMERFKNVMCIFNNKIHFIGSPGTSNNNINKKHWTWTEEEGFTELTDLTFTSANYYGVCVFNNTIYYVDYTNLYKWDIENDTWITIEKPFYGYTTLRCYDNILYLIYHEQTYIYTYDGTNFTYLTALPFSYRGYAGWALYIKQNKIHVCGYSSNDNNICKYYIYSIEDDQWNLKDSTDTNLLFKFMYPTWQGNDVTLIIDDTYTLVLSTQIYNTYNVSNSVRKYEYAFLLLDTTSEEVEEFCNNYL